MKTLVRCVIVESQVADLCFVAAALASFTSVRSDWIGFLLIGSWALLLALSIAVLFVDRRLAVRGLMVVALGGLTGLLFPAL
jgi:hypothetical protein